MSEHVGQAWVGRFVAAVWAGGAAAVAVALILQAVYRDTSAGLDHPMANNVVFAAFALSYATVGALICARRPDNRVGWMLLASGTIFALCTIAFEYADIGLADGRDLPGSVLALWIANAVSPIALELIPLALLLFPDGRPISPRWRPVSAVPAAAAFGICVGVGFLPGSIDANVPVPNPFGIPGAHGVLTAVEVAGWTLTAVSLGAAAAAIVVRLRRADGVQRLQLKWVASAGVVLGVVWILWEVTYLLPPAGRVVTALELLAATLAMTGIPLAAGVAILRYRLYEIDVIIRRTLVYATLIAVLAAFYLAGITLLEWAMESVTGQSSALAVTASTLAVAAAFQPVRSRIQHAVERHFYRTSHDSAQALQAFAGSVRDQVDLETLQQEVLTAVQATVQPGHASLWLRDR